MRTAIQNIAFVIALASSTGLGLARVNETIAECTDRYGPATFQHDNGDFSYRIFQFSNRTIKAYYFNNRSVMELIIPPEIKYLSKEQANELIGKELKFYMGLLQGSYGFADSELKDALNLQITKPDVLQSSASHDSLKAGFEVNINEQQSSIQVTIFVVGGTEFKKAMEDQALGDLFAKFRLEAITAADKHSKQKAAQGF